MTTVECEVWLRRIDEMLVQIILSEKQRPTRRDLHAIRDLIKTALVEIEKGEK